MKQGQRQSCLLVFELPMRDGNLVYETGQTNQTFVFELPMRDGNNQTQPDDSTKQEGF